MAAYRRVYDSRHLQADCEEPGSAPEPYTLDNRVWATFTFFTLDTDHTARGTDARSACVSFFGRLVLRAVEKISADRVTQVVAPVHLRQPITVCTKSVGEYNTMNVV